MDDEEMEEIMDILEVGKIIVDDDHISNPRILKSFQQAQQKKEKGNEVTLKYIYVLLTQIRKI